MLYSLIFVSLIDLSGRQIGVAGCSRQCRESFECHTRHPEEVRIREIRYVGVIVRCFSNLNTILISIPKAPLERQTNSRFLLSIIRPTSLL